MKQLGKEALLYAIGTFLRRIATFLLVPLYTATLSSAEYGVIETLNVFVQTLLIFLNFGLSNALLRYYNEGKDEADTAIMLRTSSLLVLLLSSLVFFSLLPFSTGLEQALFKGRFSYLLLLLAFGWAVGGALNEQVFAYYRARRDAVSYVLISLSTFLLLGSLNVVFVRVLRLGVWGVLFGNILATWGVTIWLSIGFWSSSQVVSVRWARVFLSFGVPLIFSRFGWLILNSADRFFLAYYRDLSEVGLYSLGYKAGLIVQIVVIVPFQLAWGPYVFAHASKGNIQNLARVFTYLVLVFGLVGTAIFMFGSEIVSLLGSSKYPDAEAVIPYVLVAYLFQGIYYWSASIFHLERRTVLMGMIVLGMAGLNVLLNRLWVPVWGWHGAAYATVVTISGTGIVMFAVAQKLCTVHLESKRLAKVALAMMLIMLVYWMVPSYPGLLGWLFRGLLLLSLTPILYAFGFFEQSELYFVSTISNSFIRKLHFRHR
jgi:O-antigen/teichoic acid export membrane protein